MPVTVAKTAGFCFGVRRAVDTVYRQLEESCRTESPKLYTLGEIIHNPQVVEELNTLGAVAVEQLPELLTLEQTEKVPVIIRSHGVPHSVYEAFEQNGIPYVDATCPYVRQIQKIVADQPQDTLVLVAGDAKHPEVKGIIGHCNATFVTFESAEELQKITENSPNLAKMNSVMVAQTTFNTSEWQKCVETAKKLYTKPKIFDTICKATLMRQTEAAHLAEVSDIMIVIGGRHSSNTRKLSDICSRYCKTIWVETAQELLNGQADVVCQIAAGSRVGVTAGASTPVRIIKEVQNTMAEILEDDINFEEALEQSFKKVHTGERVKGYIAAVNNSEAIVDIGTKHTGYVPLSELTDDQTKKPSDIVSVGEEVDLIVTKINDQEGIVTLSKKKVDELVGFDNISKAKEEDAVLDGVVLNVVKGGILVSVDGVRVFVPASQTGLGRDKNLDELLKQKVQIKIIEVNESRRRAVGSIKAVAKAQREAAKAAFWETAEIGKVYKGEVKSLTNYGAFVDLGGIDGMVHISELSWGRIKHPSQVVKVGDILEVYIKELDKESGRISLGFKKAEDNPWVKFQNNYNVGDVVKATIVSITPFGAFAQIIEGVDGLIHISQIADKRVDNVNDVLSVGQEVDVKITEIDLDKKRISISIRALLDDAAAEETEDAE